MERGELGETWRNDKEGENDMGEVGRIARNWEKERDRGKE